MLQASARAAAARSLHSGGSARLLGGGGSGSGICCVARLLPAAPQRLRGCVGVWAASNSRAKATKKAAARKGSSGAPLVVRQAIWFHHILAKGKRKVIQQWARELQLSGASKVGYPGVIVVEGHVEDVQQYTAQLRALPWAAMQVRAREEDPEAASQEAAAPEGQEAAAQEDGGQRRGPGEEPWRRLPFPLIELEDPSGLSALGELCKQARLGHMFAAALKLHSPSDPHLQQQR